LATITSYIGPLRFSAPTSTLTSAFRQRAKTASVLQAYETFPPSALPVSLTRFATAPLKPALAAFANHFVSSPPSQVR